MRRTLQGRTSVAASPERFDGLLVDALVAGIRKNYGKTKPPERAYRCHCCGEVFRTDKTQDPERDTGYGTCSACFPRVAGAWIKHEVSREVTSMAEAEARFAKYA